MRTSRSPRRWRSSAVFALLLVPGLAPKVSAQAPPCSAQWIPTYGGYPFPSDSPTTIETLAVFDDGHGPALYAGGQFATSSAPNSIAKWDGWGWTSFAAPIVGGSVHALAVFDDGSGPALYAGGGFTSIGGVAANHIAKWDGTSWAALGSGTSSAGVDALHVFNDGSGPALYIGGTFANAGGLSAQNLARWNASGWSVIATGMDAGIEAFGEYDDGSGNALYLGGRFTTAGGITCNHIVRWNGANWSALGSGVASGSASTTTVDAFAVFDDGSGPALFAGGVFTNAGGAGTNRIAKWNGTSWSALANGTNGPVSALAVFDEGSGPALYASGTFTLASGLGVGSIARWNGASWSALGSGLESGLTNTPVNALAVFDDGHGAQLHAGGRFRLAGGIYVHNIARWNASGWSAAGIGLSGAVQAVANFDDGSGPALYAAGSFQPSTGFTARTVGRWDGNGWSYLPASYVSHPSIMAAFDDGSGPALYAGDSLYGSNLSRWNGTAWSYVNPPGSGPLHCLQVLDDGSGPGLYAASDNYGAFVSKWNGTYWTSIGGVADGPILALTVFDDGTGTTLYRGGESHSPGNGIEKWAGAYWRPVGGGVGASAPVLATVHALAVFDDGSGPALFAGGVFDTAGGVVAHGIAKWDGANWSPLGSGLALAGSTPSVNSLAVFDDGSGPKLYVTGVFDSAGGVASNGFARWDGTNWTDLGFRQSGVALLAVVDDGSVTGPALIAAGSFSGATGQDAFVAKWDLPIGCTAIGTPFCSPSSAGVLPCPCSNPAGGTDRGCDNSSATGGAQLFATGLASLSNDLVQLTTAGETPSATSIVLQGTSSSASGAVFGQGVRCVAGSLKRLYSQGALQGSITAPAAGDAPVSVRSAALGDSIVAGQHRYYGVYYRDPNVLGGCPAASTFNITQQVDLLWAP